VTFNEDELGRMLDHDTQEPYEEPRAWWETPLTFAIVGVGIAIILMLVAACGSTTATCDQVDDFTRELNEELSIDPYVEGRQVNQDRVAALRSLIAEGQADCAATE